MIFFPTLLLLESGISIRGLKNVGYKKLLGDLSGAITACILVDVLNWNLEGSPREIDGRIAK